MGGSLGSWFYGEVLMYAAEPDLWIMLICSRAVRMLQKEDVNVGWLDKKRILLKYW